MTAPGPAKPALTGTTKLNNTGGVTNVPAKATRKVTYIFHCTTATNVKLPYAVAVNGQVIAAHANKTSRVTSGVKMTGKFTVDAQTGDTVSLYLNSDAAVGRRSTPVYAVTVGANDIVVKVTEKEKKHSDSDTPTLVGTVQAAAGGTPVDEYQAPLTGNIWMKVSYKYTAADVDALMPAGTTPQVIAAIKSIYNGLPSASLTVSVPANGAQAAKSLKVNFQDSNNPKNNIVGYTLLGDGLTRVHPSGFAALLNAALDNNIPSLRITSCWRPMMGSIAHRAGLGLDVDLIGGTQINREELGKAFGKNGTGKGNGNDADNVTDAEVKKFAALEAAITDAEKAQTNFDKADQELAAANKTQDPVKIAAAQAKFSAAEQALKTATGVRNKARKEWDDERNANEPVQVRLFRGSLLKCSCVRQLLDPWVMDTNTQDASAPTPNMQKTDSETGHAHHLHITVNDPQIL